jgi:hypothetical protein
MLRLAMTILWPSFLVAALAEGCFFSLFDPEGLMALGGDAQLSPLAFYTIGFFLFWSLGALASLLSCYLVMVPDQRRPPF